MKTSDTPTTLEQIARETAEKIYPQLAAIAFQVTGRSGAEADTALKQAADIILTALLTAAKQPEGADWAEAAAKEYWAGASESEYDTQKGINELISIIRRHAPRPDEQRIKNTIRESLPMIHPDFVESATDSMYAALRPLLAGQITGGCALIAAERQRQIDEWGWNEAHDDTHKDGELSAAAGCYALPSSHRIMGPRFIDVPTARGLADPDSSVRVVVSVPIAWPWGAEWWKPSPENRLKELAKAGALIVAEIDRLQRQDAAMRPEQP